MKPSNEFLLENNKKSEVLTGRGRGSKLFKNMAFLFMLSGITLFSSCFVGVEHRHHREGHERHDDNRGGGEHHGVEEHR